MTYTSIQQDKLEIKDQLGRAPSTTTIGVWGMNEDVVIEELSEVVNLRKIYSSGTDSFILGHPINGILGIASGTGGNQIRLGDYRGSLRLQRVLNPNNVYREYFRDTQFKHSNTNMTWDLTNYALVFSSGSIGQSEIIALNNETYSSCILNLSGTALGNLTPKVSFNGGVNFETVTLGTPYNATNTGTAIMWRLEATGSGTCTKVQLEYS